jgi:hypothetical protein
MSLKAYIDINHGFAIEKNTLSGGAYASPLVTGLLAYWNLNNNGSGGVSLVDSSGNSNTLTNNNNVQLGAGIIGGGGFFDGSSHLSVYSVTLEGRTTITSSCWIKYLNSNNEGALSIYLTGGASIDGTNTASLALGSVENFGLFLSINTTNGYYQSPTDYDYGDGAWHLAVLTYNSSASEAKLYVDGVLIETLFATGAIATANTYFGIGSCEYVQDVGPPFYPLYGNMDEIGLWNRALTANEVLALYNAGSGLTYPFIN